MALLRDSFTDEEEREKERQETPFDHTRIRVCLQATEGTEILFRKREKRQKHFSFSIKNSLLLLLSYLFFNSKDMTLIPGVYISTLS
jgi:hypothetical protein